MTNSVLGNLKKTYIIIMILFCFLFFGCNNATVPDNNLVYPEFINEQEVVIADYSQDAMEPFISRDGAYLFFNSLNDSVDTSIYISSKISDAEFTAPVKLPGVNNTAPHLDAVASMDSSGVFYYISTRDYPADIRNVRTGIFGSGVVTGAAPLSGDFYISSPAGWIIMDAEINSDGTKLYYVNADFSGGGALPSQAKIGIARYSEGSFLKKSDSDTIMARVNNPLYISYAPCISKDGLELYFTRIKKGTLSSEICVSVRADSANTFSEPKVLPISGTLPEAASLTDDGKRIYYHKKTPSGIYRLYTMAKK